MRSRVPSLRLASPVASLAPFGLAVAVLVLVADQLSKWWVIARLGLPLLGDVPLAPGLDFTWVNNHGVTFGLLQTASGAGHLTLGLLQLAITLLLVGWMHRADRRLVAASLGLIVGGATGNIVDRLRYGYVVDFIRAHALGYSWYVFNLADSCIVCGIGVLLIDGAFARRS